MRALAARGLTTLACALALAWAEPRAALADGLGRGSVLASYSFDDDVETGPDTFAIWQGARHNGSGRGHVRLSEAFHVSGHRSIELQDVPGDGDFPELQGYFPVQSGGRLFFHFAFLTTDTAQELNVALAGPRFFTLEKDGIAFWLATRDGRLVHYSNGVPRRLFAPLAFVWYAVDVSYDVGAGRYDLVIRAEGEPAPIVSLRGQPNAASRPASAVDKFSFVGSPFADTSSVVYYVDDVVIGSDEAVTRLPLRAPGRRKLFIDSFVEYQRLLRERPRCLPATSPDDFGFAPDDLAALSAAGASGTLQRLLAGAAAPSSVRASSERGPERWRRLLDSAAAWSDGCAALDGGDAAGALSRFEAAAELSPEGPLYPLSQALALAALRRIEPADEQLVLASPLRHDARYAVASAYVGLARKDLERALEWLHDPALRALDRDAPHPPDRVEALVTEQYYYVLLWKGLFDDARDYALRMAERAGRARLASSPWTVRVADASFYRRDAAEARELYESALAGERDWGALREIYLKLADLAWLAGDTATERRLREHYFGSLHE